MRKNNWTLKAPGIELMNSPKNLETNYSIYSRFEAD
jgi:hypothetical protein